MVNEITPAYYARNAIYGNFELSGENLDVIPDNAVGILSFDNDNPLQNLEVHSPWMVYSIAEKNEGYMLMQESYSGAVSADQNSYLGAIVSADFSTVYWQNETRPLP